MKIYCRVVFVCWCWCWEEKLEAARQLPVPFLAVENGQAKREEDGRSVHFRVGIPCVLCCASDVDGLSQRESSPR
jgi:hypothetical protein